MGKQIKRGKQMIRAKTIIRPKAINILVSILTLASLFLIPLWWDAVEISSFCPSWYPELLCPNWVVATIKVLLASAWVGLVIPIGITMLIPGLNQIEISKDGLKITSYTTGFSPIVIPKEEISFCLYGKVKKRSSLSSVITLKRAPRYPRFATNKGLNRCEARYLSRDRTDIPEAAIEHAHFLTLGTIFSHKAIRLGLSEHLPSVKVISNTRNRLTKKDLAKEILAMATEFLIGS